MATNKLQWKRIAKGDKLPCQSFLRKKNGEIPKLSTGAGIKVGQDAYYLPVDEVIEEIKNYPIEESEDDKMRKYIIASLNALIYTKGSQADKERNDAIAWLEKQGEQNPADKIEPKFKVGDKVKSIIDGFECTIESIDDTCYYGDTTNFDIQDQDGWELFEQKSAEWSEEDERMLDGIIEASTHHCYLNITDIDWLKSLKDRAQPQPKREWSEEDERIKNNLLSELTNLSVRKLIEKETEKKYASWLKSLRPQSYWRPSDKQMETLAYYMHALVCNEHKEILFGLYADLKKLKA